MDAVVGDGLLSFHDVLMSLLWRFNEQERKRRCIVRNMSGEKVEASIEKP